MHDRLNRDLLKNNSHNRYEEIGGRRNVNYTYILLNNDLRMKQRQTNGISPLYGVNENGGFFSLVRELCVCLLLSCVHTHIFGLVVVAFTFECETIEFGQVSQAK